MSTEYTKTNWQDGDIITADKMNNIENGIKDVEGTTTSLKEDLDGNIAPKNTNFVNIKYAENANIFDKSTMVETGKYWFRNDNTMTLTEYSWSTNYGALHLPLAESVNAITFSSAITYSNFTIQRIYSFKQGVFQKRDDVALTFNGMTSCSYNIDSGVDELYLDVANYVSNVSLPNPNNVMVAVGLTAKAYRDYEKPKIVIENLAFDLTDDPTIADMQSNINEIESKEAGTVKFTAPGQVHAVAGDKIQLFYRGMINAVDPDLYTVEVTGSRGKSYKRYFEDTPNAAGINTLALSLYDGKHNLVDTASLDIVTAEKPSSPSGEKVVLYVGDSLAQGGQVPVELHRRLCGEGGTPAGDNLSNIAFIGNCIKSGVKYEGYGGYTFITYNNGATSGDFMWINATTSKTESGDQHSIYKDTNNVQWKLETIEPTRIKVIRVSGSSSLPTSGTLTWVSGGTNHDSISYTNAIQAAINPFWDASENKVDFASYVARQGKTTLDFVYVLLGWNSLGLSESGYKANVRTFINNVLTSFPNCKIILMGLEVPAYDGIGNNYGVNGNYHIYYNAMQWVWTLNNWYLEISEESEYTGKVYFLNIASQFDSEYNMPTTTTQVNTRNSTTIAMQSNGVHPADSGYLQIADAAYRDLASRL